MPPEDNTGKDDPMEKRGRTRFTFTYPVEFIILTRNPLTIKGNLKNISLSGLCLEFEDPYRRIILKEALNATLKLNLVVPGIDKMSVLSKIKWIKNIENTSLVKLGIELINVTMYQIDLINKLVGLRDRDRSMFWNLWEEYHN